MEARQYTDKVCPTCNGKGGHYEDDGPMTMRGYDTAKWVVCPACGGVPPKMKWAVARLYATLEGFRFDGLAECPSCEERVWRAIEAILRVSDTVHKDIKSDGERDVVCYYGRKE